MSRASIGGTTKTGGGDIESQALIFLVLLPASLCDLYCYRVPNVILGIGFTLSLYENLQRYGWAGAGYFAWHCLIPFVVCFIFYLLHMLGAGDIKLFSVISSYYSFNFCVQVMIVSLLIGALFSVVKMLQKKCMIRRFRKFFSYVRDAMAERKFQPYYDWDREGDEGVIPFTVCISLAVILCL